MNDEKRKALKAAGWKVGSVDEFLEGDKMSDSDTMRAEFEAWAKRHNCDIVQAKGQDDYWLFHTQLAWLAYQAGQKAEREAIFIEWEDGEIMAAEVERLRAELAEAKANKTPPAT